MHTRSRFWGALAIAIIPFAGAMAQNVFTNIQSGEWSNPASWSTGAPVAGGSNDFALVFGNAAADVSTNDLGLPSFALNQLAFAGAAVTLSGQPLRFATASDGLTGPLVRQNVAAAVVIGNDITLSNTLTLAGVGTGPMTFNGTISGPGGFVRGGTANATITLNGTNTYTGGTVVSNGTLQINGSVRGDVTINDTYGQTMVRLGSHNAFEPTARFHFAAPINTGSNACYLQLNGFNITLGGITNSFFADKCLIENQAAAGTSVVTFGLTSPSSYTGKLRDNNIGNAGRTKVVVDGDGTLFMNLNTTAGTYSGGLEIRRGILSVPALNEVNAVGNLGTNSVTPVYVGYTNGSVGALYYTGASSTVSRAFALGIETGVVGILSVTETGATVTLQGPVSGPGTLVKDGLGRLRLWGTNTYAGGTVLRAGIFTVTNDVHLGLLPSTPTTNIVFASNATFQVGAPFTLDSNRTVILNSGVTGTFDLPLYNMTFNGLLTGGGVLAKTGTSTLTLGGTNTFTGGVVLQDGRLNIVSDANLGGAAAAITFNGGLLQISSLTMTNLDTHPVNWGSFNGGFDIPSGNTFFVTNEIAGPGALTKSGAGALRLTSANTYTGLTAVGGGSLQVAHPSALGSTGGVTTVASGQSVVLMNGIVVTGETVIVLGNGVGNAGGLQSFASATNEWKGGVLITGATARVGAQQNGQLTISGVISNLSAGTPLELGAGTSDTQLGTIILAGANVYDGMTRVVRGTAKLGASNTFPATTALDVNYYSSVAANAIVDLNGFDQTVGSLQRTSTGSGGSIVTNSSATRSVLTVNQLVNTNYRGIIAGNLGLNKGGAGRLTLFTSGVLSGPVNVSNGTLVINGTLGTGDVSVAAGGTLCGTGAIQGSVTSAGVVAPGDSNITKFALSGDYTQQAGGALRVKLGALGTPGTEYDLLDVTGTANLAGTLQVVLTNGLLPALGDAFVVLTAGSVNGNFTGVQPATVGSNIWAVSSLGSAIILSVVSPPTGGYDAYALRITNAAARGFQDDADADGYANLLEYVTGGNPTNADTLARTSAVRTNGLLALRFTRDTNSVDATLVVEGSFSAAGEAAWAGIATNVNGSWGAATNVIETNLASPVNEVTVIDPQPAVTSRFLRLRVSVP